MQDEDPPSETNPSPAASLTNAPEPDERKTKGRGRRVSYELWDSVYQAWKVGERSAAALGARFGLSEDTVHRYVNHGVKTTGWPSFRVRMQDETQTVQKAKEEAAAKMATQLVDEFGQVREESLKVLRALRAACTRLVGKVIERLNEAPMTKHIQLYTLVKDPDGRQREQRTTHERPLDAAEMGDLLRVIASALNLSGKMESFWLGGPTERIETIADDKKFSNDELKYIEEHDGQLPPGMTPQEVIGKMAASFGIRIAGSDEAKN